MSIISEVTIYIAMWEKHFVSKNKKKNPQMQVRNNLIAYQMKETMCISNVMGHVTHDGCHYGLMKRHILHPRKKCVLLSGY